MLFSTIGTFGRILCVLFFACLSIAGVTSLVANVEMVTHTLYDFGGNVTLSIDIKLKVNKFKTLIGINILCLCSLKCSFILMVKLLKLTEFCWVILLVPRKFGMPCTVLLLFLGGLASALNLDVLTNQVGLLYNDIGTLFQFNDLLNYKRIIYFLMIINPFEHSLIYQRTLFGGLLWSSTASCYK